MYYALFFLVTSKYEFKLGLVDSPFCSYCNKGDDDNDLQEDFLNLLTQCEALLKQSVKSNQNFCPSDPSTIPMGEL